MKLDEAIAAYVKLRDAKAQLKKQHDEKAAGIKEKMDLLEGAILKAFQSTGTESARTASGTAYIKTTTSATIADRDVFLKFVRENDAWEFLENRVNKTAVDEYRREHQDVPPGVNFSAMVTLGVRRD